MQYVKLIWLALCMGIITMGSARAQLTEQFKPDLNRALFHSRLDQAQKDMLAIDGSADSLITVYPSYEMNEQLQYLLQTRIDDWQRRVELSNTYDHNKKLTYLRSMTELLYAYAVEIRKKSTDWSSFAPLLNAFEDGLLRMEAGKDVLHLLKPLPYDVAKIIPNNFAFRNSAGIRQIQEFIFLKLVAEKPEQTLKRLAENPTYSFADSLISVAARRRPEELINYAQASGTPLGILISRHADPLVKMIVQLAGDRSGQLYFPFLDDLSKGNISKTAIETAITDSAAYYRLLVKTQVNYAGRMRQGDTPVVIRGLQDMLHRKSLEVYVNTINGLHDLPAPVRFKKIQGLTVPELYYLIVLNEAEIYTSSYTYVYKRLLELTPGKSADTLLQIVNHDKYKKFLTMAANYNTLNDLLAKMSAANAHALMSDFVSNLEKGNSKDDIEDAVDVANAYASITQPAIRALMLNKVKENLAMAELMNNRKGRVIYRLEKVIMESSDSEMDSTLAKVNISDSLGIPPVYDVSNKQLRDSLGRIVLQMYFYGDAGGKGTFNHLLRIYADRTKWAMKATPDWVQFTSIGTPVPFILFANRALDEADDQDELAQMRLIDYMTENGFSPSITVHRGHSYYLPYTIKKMLPSRVVVLGSCGAYHNLADVLRISPDASIISSKQVGYGEINVALFTYLVNKLKMGQDVKWPSMMNEVAGRISAEKKEGYDDYIFPHQNLGALFIKAYKIASRQDDPFEGITLK